MKISSDQFLRFKYFSPQFVRENFRHIFSPNAFDKDTSKISFLLNRSFLIVIPAPVILALFV